MSDVWAKIGELKVLLAAFFAAAAVMTAVGAAVMDWRVSVNVKQELSKLDIGTDAKIIAMDRAIDANARTGEENAEDIAQNRERTEAAFAVLLGRGTGE